MATVEPVLIEERTSGLADDVWENARQDPEAVQFVRPDPDARSWPAHRARRGGTSLVNCAAFRDDVQALARGLLAAGITHGDRVALISRTRYEWTLVDYAVWAIGAVTVPIYDSASPDQIEWILADSGALGCVVETAGHAAIVTGLRDRLPDLRETWQIDGGGLIALAGQGRAVADGEVDAAADGWAVPTWPPSSTPAARPAVRRAAC